jgi:gamma-glutamylcyclotransferase (GGCT)/AIG2-like uncharacterized protein YtfP
MIKVFVYGTLKPGEENYQGYCAGKVINATKAIARGKLYDLPMGYPAMIPGDSPVQGYLLSFADSGVLKELDELEDYYPTKPESEILYYRQQIETYNLQGQSLGLAWVYFMSSEKVTHFGGRILPDGWWSGGFCC